MWIKLEDGVYAETADPDPKRILTTEKLQEEVKRLQDELVMYENEIIHITQRKTEVENKISEINDILNS